jgi:hypothetical protein
MLLKSIRLSTSRAIAVLAAFTLAAVGTTGLALPALASDVGDTATDGTIVVEWSETRLAGDNNGNGSPDVGDFLNVNVGINAVPGSGVTTIDYLRFTVGGNPYSFTALGPSVGFTLGLSVTADMFQGPGTWLELSDVVFEYSANGVPQATLNAGAPPSLYVAPAPPSVETTVELESTGTAPTRDLLEGDRVRSVATVTNPSVVDLTIASADGFTSPSLPVVLGADESVTLYGAWREVTLADMKAGFVQWDVSAIDWQADSYQGVNFTEQVSADTAEIDASFEADVAIAIHDADQTVERAVGDVVVGDRIDYTYELKNTGNVVFDYVYLVRQGLSSLEGFSHTDAGLPAGESLPHGDFVVSWTTSETNGPEFTPHLVTSSDLQRGYVDLDFDIRAAPSSDWYFSHEDDSSTIVSKRVFLRDLDSEVDWSANAVLQDINGDGVGQAGEDVEMTWTASLPADAEQSVALTGVDESGQFAGVGSVFDGVVLAPGDSSTHAQIITIDELWLASGALDYSATLHATGSTDAVDRSFTSSADAVELGAFVAPPVSLNVAQSFGDLNGDGEASIGETVTFDVTVANDGTYPLTGVSLGEAGGATLPADALAVSDVAPGASAAWTATHVVTAADFAAGEVVISPTVDADGMDTLTESARVAPVTFAAYEADLDSIAGGGIAVCSAAGEHVSSASQGDVVTVLLGGCDGEALDAGSRVMAFSSPMLLGLGESPVTIPAALAAGDHRIAVYAADGALVGWTAISISEPVEAVEPTVEPTEEPTVEPSAQPAAVVAEASADSDTAELSTTGANGIGPMLGLATALMLAGLGGVFVARRRLS